MLNLQLRRTIITRQLFFGCWNSCVTIRSIALFLVFFASSMEAVQAVSLNTGDIIVAAQSFGNLYKVDPISGSVSTISSGGLLGNPSHLVLDNQGRILTAERTGGTSPGIVRIDPTTGMQTLVASGSLLNYPVALAFEENNNLVVGNVAGSFNTQLVRVNVQTGTAALLATLANFRSIQDVDVDQQGQIVALDFGFFNSGGGKIVRINPSTGQQVTVSSGGNLFNPSDLIIRPTGDYVVSNKLQNQTTQILEIDSVTGTQQILATLPSEGFIALQDQNAIVYADFYHRLSILRVNLLTGQTQTVSNYSNFWLDLTGVAVYSPVPEPSTLILLGMSSIGLGACAWRYRK